MHQKKVKMPANIQEWLKLVFSLQIAPRQPGAADSPRWLVSDVRPASSLMTSSPFYYLIGRPRCGLIVLTFAKPYHLPAQDILMAAAHFLRIKADSPPTTKLEAPIARNVQIPLIKFEALKCVGRVDLQVQTPCINPS